ncbi:hypothetical protein ACWEQL_32535 [Kitasatospora sp. NPDC004240]
MPEPPLDALLANALAATRYAVATAFAAHAERHHLGARSPAEPDDFDAPQFASFIHQLGYEADESTAAHSFYRLLLAVQRIAYDEGAGRNSDHSPARLNPVRLRPTT